MGNPVRCAVRRRDEAVETGELAAFCERMDIDLLVLFGSAATPARSTKTCGSDGQRYAGLSSPYAEVMGTHAQPVATERIRRMPVASFYPHYVTKVERKGRTQAEVDQVICWLTGYDDAGLRAVLEDEVDLETFFAHAPALNANASLITGVICGYRVEDIDDPLMQKIRYMDKLVDEVAKGKAMEKILRSA